MKNNTSNNNINMKNCIFLVIVMTILFLFIFDINFEKFSSSGLTFDDKYCRKIANVYNRPHIVDQGKRNMFNKRICGEQRKNEIYENTGNYYTINGQLI